MVNYMTIYFLFNSWTHALEIVVQRKTIDCEQTTEAVDPYRRKTNWKTQQGAADLWVGLYLYLFKPSEILQKNNKTYQKSQAWLTAAERRNEVTNKQKHPLSPTSCWRSSRHTSVPSSCVCSICKWRSFLLPECCPAGPSHNSCRRGNPAGTNRFVRWNRFFFFFLSSVACNKMLL